MVEKTDVVIVRSVGLRMATGQSFVGAEEAHMFQRIGAVVLKSALFAAVVAALSGVCAASSTPAAFVYEAAGVDIASDGIRGREEWRVVDRIGFDNPSDWKINNFSKLLSIAAGREFLSARCLYIGGATNRRDTAWNVKTPKFTIPKGVGRCRVQMKAYSDKMLSASMDPLVDISRERWQNAVFWYDESGREIGTGPFTYFINGEGCFSDVVSELTVPDGAVGGALRFGFDSPNLGPGEKDCRRSGKETLCPPRVVRVRDPRRRSCFVARRDFGAVGGAFPVARRGESQGSCRASVQRSGRNRPHRLRQGVQGGYAVRAVQGDSSFRRQCRRNAA